MAAVSKEEKTLMQDGMEHLRQGKLEDAERIMKQFLNAYSKSDLADNACYNLAQICMKRGEKQKALEWLDYILQHYPDSDAAYMAQDQRIEVMRLLGIGPDETPDECYMKGKTALGLGNFEEAKKLFHHFLETYPTSNLIDNAHYNLAMICKQLDDRNGTRHHIKIIMDQYPDSDAAIYAQDLLADLEE